MNLQNQMGHLNISNNGVNVSSIPSHMVAGPVQCQYTFPRQCLPPAPPGFESFRPIVSHQPYFLNTINCIPCTHPQQQQPSNFSQFLQPRPEVSTALAAVPVIYAQSQDQASNNFFQFGPHTQPIAYSSSATSNSRPFFLAQPQLSQAQYPHPHTIGIPTSVSSNYVKLQLPTDQTDDNYYSACASPLLSSVSATIHRPPLQSKSIYTRRRGKRNADLLLKQYPKKDIECHYNMITTEDQTNIFLKDLENKRQIIGLDCEGVNLGSDGNLTVIQIITADDDEVYIFDILESPQLIELLKPLLESHEVIKIMCDCRSDSANLFWQFKVRLNNVFDIQLAQFIIDGDNSLNYNAISEKYGFAINTEKDVVKSIYKYDFRIWVRRPINETLLSYAASDVKNMIKIYEKMKPLMTQSDEEFFDELCKGYISHHISTENANGAHKNSCFICGHEVDIFPKTKFASLLKSLPKSSKLFSFQSKLSVASCLLCCQYLESQLNNLDEKIKDLMLHDIKEIEEKKN